jgi:hypothetical protein
VAVVSLFRKPPKFVQVAPGGYIRADEITSIGARNGKVHVRLRSPGEFLDIDPDPRLTTEAAADMLRGLAEKAMRS